MGLTIYNADGTVKVDRTNLPKIALSHKSSITLTDDAWTDVTWDTEDHKDDGYTHSTSSKTHQVTIDESGDFLCRFSVGGNTGGSFATLLGRVLINSSEIENSIVGVTTRYTGTIDTIVYGSVVHKSFVLRDISAGDVLVVQCGLQASGANRSSVTRGVILELEKLSA